MIETFRETLIGLLFRPNGLLGPDLVRFLDPVVKRNPDLVRAMNVAFLVALSGNLHPDREKAIALLQVMARSEAWGPVAAFYLEGVRRILLELDARESDAELQVALIELARWLEGPGPLEAPEETAEKTWPVFHPEAAGIRGREAERCEALRRRRTVDISRLNSRPLVDPASELLLTANVLLTVPSAPPERFPPQWRARLAAAAAQDQTEWYDHPIPIGTEARANEILYGLRHLDGAVAFEKRRGACPGPARLTVVLSASVTHPDLEALARPYVASVTGEVDPFSHLRVFLFTEADVRALVDRVLAPAASRFLGRADAREKLAVFGVSGAYGRHYSFLKAVAALWAMLVDPRVRATFKIDLDQVFPQERLVRDTGKSAFEHFRTPLWGAEGTDADGMPVELGMLAGALVNQADIETSLFAPDVGYPGPRLAPEAFVFCSRLPQALSTEAEMGLRYRSGSIDGIRRCIERVHVTGGTNGILVDHLERHRPFTPSFVGRAEDQAYLMSVFRPPSPRLAYAHEDGLIMRHDKAGFAGKAVEDARIDALVGDFVRTLIFSAYARALGCDVRAVKGLMDPFSGGFISRIPTTVAYLRFALQAEGFFAGGDAESAMAFVRSGAKRISEAMSFCSGRESRLYRQLQEEREGWELYYSVLAAMKTGLERGDPEADRLRGRAGETVEACRLRC